MIDLFHCEPDVCIRLLQLRMHISAVYSPEAPFQDNLFVESSLDDRDRLKLADAFRH